MSGTGTAFEIIVLRIIKALTWLVYVAATAAIIFLGFDFVLRALGANPDQAFAAFIYRWAHVFLGPFTGLVKPTLTGKIAYLNWNALIGMAAYAVLAWLIGFVLDSLSRRLARDQAAQRLGRTAETSSAPAAAPEIAPAEAAPTTPPVSVAPTDAPAAPQTSPDA
ncbi:MAG: hypothetical protein WCJ13_04705 [Coriobacteriia bacterium]